MNNTFTTINNVVFNLAYESRHGRISCNEESKTVICTLLSSYVPMAEFRNLLDQVSILVKEKQIAKFILDKRKLTIFHQPSMEWYHVYWKEEMYGYGLKSHRKLIPDDHLFAESIQIGRRKIKQENPDFDFNKYDIVYCKTLEEALAK